MLIVSVCYFLVNISFFTVLSYHEILSTQAVALVRDTVPLMYTITSDIAHPTYIHTHISLQPFGKAVMGKAGLVVIPLLVALATFGTNLSDVYASSRYEQSLFGW